MHTWKGIAAQHTQQGNDCISMSTHAVIGTYIHLHICTGRTHTQHTLPTSSFPSNTMPSSDRGLPSPPNALCTLHSRNDPSTADVAFTKPSTLQHRRAVLSSRTKHCCPLLPSLVPVVSSTMHDGRTPHARRQRTARPGKRRMVIRRWCWWDRLELLP